MHSAICNWYLQHQYRSSSIPVFVPPCANLYCIQFNVCRYHKCAVESFFFFLFFSFAPLCDEAELSSSAGAISIRFRREFTYGQRDAGLRGRMAGRQCGMIWLHGPTALPFPPRSCSATTAVSSGHELVFFPPPAACSICVSAIAGELLILIRLTDELFNGAGPISAAPRHGPRSPLVCVRLRADGHPA